MGALTRRHAIFRLLTGLFLPANARLLFLPFIYHSSVWVYLYSMPNNIFHLVKGSGLQQKHHSFGWLFCEWYACNLIRVSGRNFCCYVVVYLCQVKPFEIEVENPVFIFFRMRR